MTERPGPSRLGEIVGGKYRIVRLLAKGGMGVVYEAQHLVVRRRFAVKFLHPELAERREILTRFQREAEAAGALESENVIAAIDFGIADDGTPFIVMEYLLGESLAALIAREERLPVGRAADLVVQACRGIAAAHASGIVHRDLKPHNLFVCRRDDGTDLVKVLDFGVAKLQAFDESKTATRSGAVLGTVAYMSPEQARGDKVIDHRADVYALGAILYELLSGQRPHPGESPNAMLHHICTQPAVALDVAKLELPVAIADIATCALSSDPQARPPSAEALGAALAPFAKREVWPAPPAPSVEDAAHATGESSAPAGSGQRLPASAATASNRIRQRSRRAVAAAAAGAIVVAAVVAIVVASGRPQDRPPPAAAESPSAAAPSIQPGTLTGFQTSRDGLGRAEPVLPHAAPHVAAQPSVAPTTAVPVSLEGRAAPPQAPSPLPAARAASSRPTPRPAEAQPAPAPPPALAAPAVPVPAPVPAPAPPPPPPKADPIGPKFDPQNPYE